MVKTVDVQEEWKQLRDLLNQVRQGVEVVLTEEGKPVARLVPVKTRTPGLHAGAISTSDDFDEPLPDDWWSNGSETAS